MEKYLLKIKPKHYGAVAFCLTTIAMYLMFAYEEVLSTGRYVILEGDLLQQYIPFIKMLARDILQGENLWYSWSLSMGMNTSLCYAYYVLSPFNLLFLIFYNVDEAIITAGIIILKTALSAFFFQKFVSSKLKCDGVESIVFSIFYAMCSYNVIYNVLNIAWIDALYMLPLISGFIIDYIKENKWKGLVAAYAYLFVTQFYMAYIVGFFTALFFVTILLCYQQINLQRKLAKVGMYVVIVCIAVCVTTVVWMPSLFFLLQNSVATDASIDLKLNIGDIFKNMFWGQMQGLEGVYPYIYCGMPTLILTPLFFVTKKNSAREKIICLILIVSLISGMLIEPFYFFIHAFDVPNSLGFRFSFILSFVLCAIGCYQYKKMREIDKKYIFIIATIEVILYVIVTILQSEVDYIIDLKFQIITLIFNIMFMLCWIGCLLYSRRINCKKTVVCALCLFLAVVEMVSNGFICFKHEGADNLERHYNIYKDSINYTINELKEDEDFYRVYYINDWNHNSDSWFGYKGLSDFCSAVNINYQKMMAQLGFISTNNTTYDVGITPVTEMIFGIKYIVEGTHPYIMAVSIPDPVIHENPIALSLGYMVSEKITEYQFANNGAFVNMNELLSTMTDSEIMCFEPISENMVTIYEENAELNYENNSFIIRKVSSDEDDGIIKYSIRGNDDRSVYVQFQREHIYYSLESPLLLGGNENSVYDMGRLTGAYAKELARVDGGYEVVIQIASDNMPAIAYQQANFCYYNEDELIKAYDILSQNQMVIREYGNTYIDAYVTVPDERTVLFTSIPYDEGWTVYVDGVETQTHAVVGDAFLALELEPGYHDLEFEYEAPGARMGMTGSGVSVGLYAGCILIEYMIKRKRKAKEGTIEPDVEDRTE